MDGKGTGLVAWRKGPWVPSVDLWLDAPPVVRGLRFVSSCQVAAGRHGDRAIASAFTGRFHFGSDGAFLSAPPREPIRLGPVEARLLPSGHVLGGMQLHLRARRGTMLYTPGFSAGGTALAEPAQLLPAETWVLSLPAAPWTGPPWFGWVEGIVESLAGLPDPAVHVARPWLALELAAALAARGGPVPRVDISRAALERWVRAGGPRPLAGSGEGFTLSLAPVGEDWVVIPGPEEEATRLRVPRAPTLEEILAAARLVAAEEILLAGPAARPWCDALLAAGLPARVLGEGPRRLL